MNVTERRMLVRKWGGSTQDVWNSKNRQGMASLYSCRGVRASLIGMLWCLWERVC